MNTVTPSRSTLSIKLGYAAFVVLGFIEVLTQYDVLARRFALLSTDIAAIVGLFLLQMFLKRKGHHLPAIVLWSVFVGAFFDAAGNFAHLYGDLLWWDKVAHTVGSAALATSFLALATEFRSTIPFGRSYAWTSLFVLGTTTTLSVLYEIGEYFGDVLFHTHRVTDLFDTADDLMWNIVGISFILITFAILRKFRHPTGLDSSSVPA